MIDGTPTVLVGFAIAVAAQRMLRVQWRWLGTGALLWFTVLVLKETLFPLLDAPAWEAMQKHLSKRVYCCLGAGYGGMISGGVEVVITLAAGLLWRRLGANAPRAVAIGVGAGTGEAVILGFCKVVLAVMTFARGMQLLEVTFLISLAFPLGRMMVIPSHVAVRAMTLYAIATGRWWWFWLAFALFSVIDGTATLLAITDASKTVSPWIMQIWPLGFAAVSIPLIEHVWRCWPPDTTSAAFHTNGSNLVASRPSGQSE